MSEPLLEQLLGLPHLTITGHELPNATTVILDKVDGLFRRGCYSQCHLLVAECLGQFRG